MQIAFLLKSFTNIEIIRWNEQILKLLHAKASNNLSSIKTDIPEALTYAYIFIMVQRTMLDDTLHYKSTKQYPDL